MNIKNKTRLAALFLMLALFVSSEVSAMTAVRRAAAKSCAAIRLSTPRVKLPSIPSETRAFGSLSPATGSFSNRPVIKSPVLSRQPKRSYTYYTSHPKSAAAERLLLAVISDNQDMLHNLVKRKAVDLNALIFDHRDRDRAARDRADFTILHVAVMDPYPNLDMIDALVAFGANVNAKSRDGDTPLHEAVKNFQANIDLVKTLVRKGANPNEVNNDNHSPLYVAQKYMFDVIKPSKDDDRIKNFNEIISFLEPLTKESPRFVPMTKESLRFVPTLKDTLEIAIKNAEKDADLSTLKELLIKQQLSSDVLAQASSWIKFYYGSSSVNVLGALIDAGLDVNTKNMYGDTLLHRAAISSNLPAVKLLLAKQADPNAVNSEGKTALNAALTNYTYHQNPFSKERERSDLDNRVAIIRLLDSVTTEDTEVPAFSRESDLD
ncbi:MAG: ankyrin repeat domain-containing protein [Epsilonproteobacteria bacterium]|nr:ankyrin repeat domain-containing protein [Campylobacterota bacterium]